MKLKLNPAGNIALGIVVRARYVVVRQERVSLWLIP